MSSSDSANPSIADQRGDIQPIHEGKVHTDARRNLARYARHEASLGEGGKQRSKTLYGLRSAKNFKAQVEARLAERKEVDPIKGRIKYDGLHPSSTGLSGRPT